MFTGSVDAKAYNQQMKSLSRMLELYLSTLDSNGVSMEEVARLGNDVWSSHALYVVEHVG